MQASARVTPFPGTVLLHLFKPCCDIRPTCVETRCPKLVHSTTIRSEAFLEETGEVLCRLYALEELCRRNMAQSLFPE